MRENMIIELENIVTQLFKSVDDLDVPNVVKWFADDIQMVEEISGKWTRGKNHAEKAFTDSLQVVSDIHSKGSEFHTLMTGESALLTCLLTQTYIYQGNPVSLVAPTTVAFRRENGEWKIILLHSLPVS
jgi:ketosteroid isomerase-like protein